MYKKLKIIFKKGLIKTNVFYWVYIILASTFVFFYGWFRCKYIKNYKDVLQFSLWKYSDKYELDCWSLSHFINFFIIGFYHPNTIILTSILGVLWNYLNIM